MFQWSRDVDVGRQLEELPAIWQRELDRGIRSVNLLWKGMTEVYFCVTGNVIRCEVADVTDVMAGAVQLRIINP